ncbi:hypothetical protein NPIL_401771 [Nephila pilipes]|uniref:Uncharacterized protein n=1 Tax=Nephila pilipes TaxID=299642 RepID=A0A8X6ID13_NEPPI|nr:hypothetical protein NPIL_401771 [Nephila pilipes]
MKQASIIVAYNVLDASRNGSLDVTHKESFRQHGPLSEIPITQQHPLNKLPSHHLGDGLGPKVCGRPRDITICIQKHNTV